MKPQCGYRMPNTQINQNVELPGFIAIGYAIFIASLESHGVSEKANTSKAHQ